MKKLEIVAVVGFMAVAIICIQQGLKLSFIVRNIPGPGFMPIVIGGTMLVFSIILLFTSVLKTKDEASSVHFNKKMIATVVGLVLYTALIKPLGYVPSTLIFCLIQFHFWGSYKWYKTVSISFIATVVMYFVFIYWIKIPINAGLGL